MQSFLAARTGESSQAWLGRDAHEWCRDNGISIDSETLDALDRVTAQLDERSYAGGTDSQIEAAQILAVADRLVNGGL